MVSFDWMRMEYKQDEHTGIFLIISNSNSQAGTAA
jgi:hypothetical protein